MVVGAVSCEQPLSRWCLVMRDFRSLFRQLREPCCSRRFEDAGTHPRRGARWTLYATTLIPRSPGAGGPRGHELRIGEDLRRPALTNTLTRRDTLSLLASRQNRLGTVRRTRVVAVHTAVERPCRRKNAMPWPAQPHVTAPWRIDDHPPPHEQMPSTPPHHHQNHPTRFLRLHHRSKAKGRFPVRSSA